MVLLGLKNNFKKLIMLKVGVAFFSTNTQALARTDIVNGHHNIVRLPTRKNPLLDRHNNLYIQQAPNPHNKSTNGTVTSTGDWRDEVRNSSNGNTAVFEWLKLKEQKTVSPSVELSSTSDSDKMMMELPESEHLNISNSAMSDSEPDSDASITPTPTSSEPLLSSSSRSSESIQAGSFSPARSVVADEDPITDSEKYVASTTKPEDSTTVASQQITPTEPEEPTVSASDVFVKSSEHQSSGDESFCMAFLNRLGKMIGSTMCTKRRSNKKDEQVNNNTVVHPYVGSVTQNDERVTVEQPNTEDFTVVHPYVGSVTQNDEGVTVEQPNTEDFTVVHPYVGSVTQNDEGVTVEQPNTEDFTVVKPYSM